MCSDFQLWTLEDLGTFSVKGPGPGPCLSVALEIASLKGFQPHRPKRSKAQRPKREKVPQTCFSQAAMISVRLRLCSVARPVSHCAVCSSGTQGSWDETQLALPKKSRCHKFAIFRLFFGSRRVGQKAAMHERKNSCIEIVCSTRSAMPSLAANVQDLPKFGGGSSFFTAVAVQRYAFAGILLQKAHCSPAAAR
ncbi:unnamed protein product [Effrenium voratum]|nr:unnamed protein product [Effrenium voratum]